jgi:hypothetical protein
MSLRPAPLALIAPGEDARPIPLIIVPPEGAVDDRTRSQDSDGRKQGVR